MIQGLKDKVVIVTGGVLSPVAIFYVWPIVSASLLLPHWA